MSETETPRATLLVVDDIPSNIDLLVGVLDHYDVIPATSGEEALEILKREAIDLVLLDIVMPGMGGFEVCRAMKAERRSRDIPVVFITARDDLESIEQAYAAGGYDYISKPIHAVELLARVNAQLELHSQYRQLQNRNSELDLARAALAASEERYRLAMDAVKDGLWDWDLARETVYFSPSWARILGEQQVPGRYESWEQRVHPEDLERITESLQGHLAGKIDQWVEEHRLRHADGSWVWVMGRGRVVQRDQAGGALRMIGTMVDISESRKHRTLLELRQRLAELLYGNDLQQLMRAALDAAEEMTDSEIGFYHFVEPDQETVSLQVWSTNTLENMCLAESEDHHYPLSKAGVWADCVRRREPVVHNDYPSLPNKQGMPEGHAPLSRELTVPVIREGVVVAVMGVGNKARDYDVSDIQLLGLVADMCQDLVERKHVAQRIEHMAFNDPLTGLANRALLMDRLQHEISLTQRANRVLGICYLDLDGFKPVNDRHGHHVGDALLVSLARRFEEGVREGDTAARLGGDEFVLLLANLESVGDGEAIVERLLEKIAEPYHIHGREIRISASAGLTFFPEDNADAAALLKHADSAMYQAKKAGPSRQALYLPVFERLKRRRRQIHSDLESALEKGFLELYYQPRIELATGRVASVEALLRWNHPAQGLLLPSQFLPMIASTPLETRVESWVLQQAWRQHCAWKLDGLLMPVSVNVSPRYLGHQAFDSTLRELQSATTEGIAGYLEIELLDPDAIVDLESASAKMMQVAQQGLVFSLDDSSAGYEAVTGVRGLPVDILKVDRAFVTEILDHEKYLETVERVVSLGQGLGCPLVAEGVESIEVAMMLLSMGCEYAQGFAIAPPLPAAQLDDWLKRWQQRENWHGLQSEVQDVDLPPDLAVAVSGHRKWLKNLIAYIESDAGSDHPALDDRQCQVGRWIRGVGGTRYSHHPSFTFVETRHRKLHRLANRIIDNMDNGRLGQVPEVIQQLQTYSEELDKLLRGLVTKPPPRPG